MSVRRLLPTRSGGFVKITKDVVGDDKNRLLVDKDALERIFNQKDVFNSPVAIYCIAGRLRGGKSFFLNFVLRYLKFKVGLKTGSWLDDKAAKINEGFEWRRGQVTHTKGILIWGEPFWIETAQHGKVALFLMDTQGFDDDSASPETDATNLFSLASLLSSYLIYNMKDVMNQNDLNQLKTSTDFAKKMTTKYEYAVQQTLLFLVRDWQDPEFDYGFEGGSPYLKKTFTEVSGTSEHYKDLCDNIKTSFKEVKCALLPHPGKKFVRMKNPTFEDIDEDFLEEVELLLHDMFENISVKHLGDKPLTGKDVINQAITFSKHMENSRIDADMLFDITSQSFLANLIGRCEEKFAEETKALTTSYRSDDELTEFYTSLVEEVLNLFNSEINISPSEETAVNAQTTLRQSLNERFYMLRNANDFSKQGVHDLYRALVNDALANFKDTLSVEFETKKMKSFVISNDFKDKMEKYGMLATQFFEGTVSKHKMSSEIFSKYMEKLEATINLQQQLFKSKNDFVMIRVEKELLKASIRTIDSFKQGFKKGVRPTETDKIDTWFEKLIESSLASFKSSKVDKELEMYKNGEAKLKETLSQLASIYKTGIDIETEGKISGEEVTKLIATIKIYFEKKIPMGSMNDISECESDQKYKEVRDDIASLVSKTLRTKHEEIIKRLCDNLQDESKVDHQLLKDKFLLEMVSIEKACAKKLQELLNAEERVWLLRKVTFTNAESKVDELDKEKQKLMKMFRKVVKDKEGKLGDVATKALENLNALFDHARKTSQQYEDINKLNHLEIAEKIRTIMILRYSEQMDEMLKMTQAKEEKLKEIHDKILREYSKSIEKKFGSNPVTKIAFNTFKEISFDQYTKWCSVNNFHVNVYPRELSRWAEIVLKVKKMYQEWWDGNVANMRIINLPPDWVLSPKFGEHSAKFTHLKLMN